VATGDVDTKMASVFQHEALIYSGGHQFLTKTVPFVSNALAVGEPVLVAVSKRNTELLQGELGPDIAGVGFVAMEELGRNPARLIPFWRDFLDEAAGRPGRGIGEPIWPGREAAEIDECQRHEYLLNLAFPYAAPLTLLCSYDGSALPDEVLGAVACSHHAVLHDGVEASGGYRPGCDCYKGRLPRHPPGAEAFPYDRARLSLLRRRVKQAAERAGIAPAPGADLVVAASELAANSVAHGGGKGIMYIWRDEDCLLIDFEDRGRISKPLAGRLRPATTQRGGRGLWLANQLCDLVQIRSSALGTTVRLRTAAA
jgi:anti-sigma regulatory factor (Ser/Thr protein kinase)